MTETHLQKAVARRLEEAREAAGFSSLRAFWRELVERGHEVSYTACRNYHDAETDAGRMPPVDYLNAVSRLFRVRLEWLVRGEGQMYGVVRWHEEEMERVAEKHEPGFSEWPDGARRTFLDLAVMYYRDTRGLVLGDDSPEAEYFRTNLTADLLKLVTFPLGAWGFRSLDELSGPERHIYFNAMLNALMVARRDAADPAADYSNSRLPRIRKVLETEGAEDDEGSSR